ncbi:MAG: CRTAC1 family protein [Bryobacterales bacterium]
MVLRRVRKNSFAWIVLALWGAALSAAETVRYVDVAAAAGLTRANVYGNTGRNEYILETTGNGVAIFDFDADGDNDVFIASGTRLGAAKTDSPPQLYRNDGAGKFADIAESAGLARTGWAQGVCTGDYDNDGRTDLLVTYYGVNRLYRNRGDGTFEDATVKAALPTTGTRWGSGCSFVDYDKDGFLDFFVANYVDLDLEKTPKPGQDPNCMWKGVPVMCGPRGLPLAQNALYRNRGDGAFEDVSQKAGILAPGGRYGLGVVAADFDNDSWPDIYVACDMTASLLYRNRGDGTFEDAGAAAGVAYNVDGQLQAGMGVAVTDYDGNGFLDIVKTNFSGDLPSLYNNEDGVFFEDVSQPAGLGANQLLGWGVLFLDADEDGRPDILMAHGHVYPEVDKAEIGEVYRQKTLLYRNLGDGRFRDITAQAGPALQVARPSRGMASGDLDGDGSPEVVIVNMNLPPTLLRNEGARGNSVWVRLEGVKSNRSAIGARVTLEAGGRRQMQEVLGGGGYFSQNEPALHFGLGETKAVDKLEVRWPAGSVQTWEGLDANHKYVLTEGRNEFAKTAYKKSPDTSR